MQFCCFPKIDISHYSEDLLEWIFFKFSLVENLKKNCYILGVLYCTAADQPKDGKGKEENSLNLRPSWGADLMLT